MIYSKAKYIPSPHFNQRPDISDICLLVIHNISLPPGEFGGPFIEQFFSGQLDPSTHPYFEQIGDLKVSSHFLIDRDGHLTQFVDTDDRAWHAGVSCWRERENCNDFSIGIELEGTDSQSYTQAQYLSLVELTLKLMADYPKITKDNIVGHCDIAPGRKTDPGEAFDWNHFYHLLAQVNDDS